MSVPLQGRQWHDGGGLGKMKTVPMSRIEFSQGAVDEQKVTAMAKALRKGKQMPPPKASINAHNVVTIHDGHHRVAAHMKTGKRSIRVQVF